MFGMRFPKILLTSVAVGALLAGCGSSPWGDGGMVPRLEGERIDVTLRPATLQEDPTATEVPFALPQPERLENWPQRGANAAHVPGHLSLPQSVVRAWSANIGSGIGRGAALLNPPVIHSGRIFMIDTAGRVSALNAKTGAELWQAKLPLADKNARGIAGGLAVSGNLLFATTGAGQVFALTATKGEQVWEINLNVPLRGAPTVAGETVFVPSHDNRMFALSALNGALQWTHSGVEESLTLLSGTSVAVGNGLAAVPYSSGEIYVLRASDGRYVWHDTLRSPFSGRDPAMTLSAVAAPPVIADGLLYVVGMNGGLSAYGLVNGQRFWRTQLTTSQLPVVAGSHLFVVTEEGQLAALNRKDGAARWVVALDQGLPETKARRFWSGPLLAGGRLIIASNDGYAVSYDPETGRKLAATEIDAGVSVPPIAADGMLYFLTDAGRLVAFAAR